MKIVCHRCFLFRLSVRHVGRMNTQVRLLNSLVRCVTRNGWYSIQYTMSKCGLPQASHGIIPKTLLLQKQIKKKKLKYLGLLYIVVKRELIEIWSFITTQSTVLFQFLTEMRSYDGWLAWLYNIVFTHVVKNYANFVEQKKNVHEKRVQLGSISSAQRPVMEPRVQSP